MIYTAIDILDEFLAVDLFCKSRQIKFQLQSEALHPFDHDQATVPLHWPTLHLELDVGIEWRCGLPTETAEGHPDLDLELQGR